MSLSLQLLGTPRVSRDGLDLVLPLKRGMALLAYLAVCERPQSREVLTALLWPDASAQEGRARLRRTLYRIQRSLGVQAVTAKGDALALNPELDWAVDLHQFRRCLDKALGAAGQPREAAAAVRALSEAVSLHRGGFMEGFGLPESDAFEDWHSVQTEDVRRALERALSQLAELQGRSGDHAAAIETARRLVSLDPLDERAQRLLMRLQLAAGAPAAALRQFETCRSVLQLELGVAPEPDTLALAESIRAGRGVGAGAPATPEVGYARSGDVHIAYQVVGEQGPPLVLIPGFVSHLEKIWEDPALAGMLRQVARRSRLVLMDRRGVGLSDRVGYEPTLERTADDVLAVMDAAGAARAAVMGISEGGPSSIQLAATHPERVRALILWGTTPKAVRDADEFPPAIPRPLFRAWLDQLVAGWGGPSSIELFAPSVADDPDTRRWWAGMMRSGSSPGGIVRVLEAFMDMDVRPLLSRVRAPTLVLHRRDDRMIRAAAGRYMAETIPGARLVELEGADHWMWTGRADAVVEAIGGFLSGVAD